ncbi:stage III sporulation protein AG [Melghirimyces profundicolus]|uniref:Stage III sporulation protein AG n=1 Tax=Melghirimyces profundicolus TaxID=1242148 RepID=A0A2T6BCX9_9BACL|nr:stage III sporulation protein AG [Melghirimyces profundicolus]PTX53921.1 stage III sporulation protein AG [Melghirimyces profundicolus]
MLKRFLDRLERALEGGEGGGKKGNTFRWLIVIGCLGVALMILSSFFSVHQEVVPPEAESSRDQEESASTWKSGNEKITMKEYEEMYESQLSEVLNNIVGVDDVSVMVNLDSSEEKVLEKDVRQSEQFTDEKDKSGGTRKIRQDNTDEKVVLQQNGDGQQPIVVKKLKPKVRGVLVVAKGAENLKVKAAMIEAIQRLMDVPIHRISVMPKG